MFEDDYLQLIQHAKGEDKENEKPDESLMAFKLDDSDGIAKAVGFHAAMLSKVDYFLSNNHVIQLIELSDLAADIKQYNDNIEKILNHLKETQKKQIDKSQEKDIVKEAWKDSKTEFMKKWLGSIAVVERLYRKNNESADTDPSYELLIVCKNHTDVKMLDGLKNQLIGMIAKVKICDTSTLKSHLIEQIS